MTNADAILLREQTFFSMNGAVGYYAVEGYQVMQELQPDNVMTVLEKMTPEGKFRVIAIDFSETKLPNIIALVWKNA